MLRETLEQTRAGLEETRRTLEQTQRHILNQQALLSDEETKTEKVTTPFKHAMGSLASILSGNPFYDPYHDEVFKEVNDASYSTPVDYFRRKVTLKTKSGEDKELNTLWVETDRGAYTFFRIAALGIEDGEHARIPMVGVAFSEDPDFLAKAFLGSDKEKAEITEDEFEQKVELIISRFESQLERHHRNDPNKETYYDMGWAMRAIKEDMSQKEENFLNRGSSITPGPDIQRGSTTIVYRRPYKDPLLQRLKAKLSSAFKRSAEEKPDQEPQYSVRIYANPEFGKLNLRLTEKDMEYRLVKSVMHMLSIPAHEGPLSDKDSKSIMRQEFAKAAWAQDRYIHPYDMHPLNEHMNPTNMKGFKAFKASPLSFVGRVGRKILSNTGQRMGHILANLNKPKVVAAALMGLVITGALFAWGLAFGIVKGAQSLLTSTVLINRAGKGMAAALKSGAKALSPIIPLTINKRQDKSPLIAKFKSKLRPNEALGGWVMNYRYLKHAKPLPYEMAATSFPDACDYTASTRRERAKQVLLNSLSMGNGTNFEWSEEDGQVFLGGIEPNGTRRLFDTSGLVSWSERCDDPLEYSMLDGTVKEFFDSLEHDDRFIGVRHIGKDHLRRDENGRPKERKAIESDFMIVSKISEAPADFVTKYAKSAEQLEEELGCSLDDFDTAAFDPMEFMDEKDRKAAMKKIEKQKAEASRSQILKNQFEAQRITALIRSRNANDPDRNPQQFAARARGRSARSGGVDSAFGRYDVYGPW